jgi:outer membrane lipopolysaccharide assembly protein LptE/RlpB
MELLMTAALATLNDFSNKVPEQHTQQIKEALYDNFNEAASTVLTQFMPDNELRPDLTEEAIKRMEDVIMKEVIEEHKHKAKEKH